MIYAEGMQVIICGNPKCRGVHVVLFDDDDNPVAEVRIPGTELRSLIKALQDGAYEIAAMRDA
jgi:hypothetical protein